MAARCLIAVVVFFHNLFGTVHSMKNGRSFMGNLDRRGSDTVWDAFFDGFTPPDMVFISSPMGGKVSYVQLNSDLKAVGGVVLPLLDAGLEGPTGLAWDSPRSALYICSGKKILRVRLKAFKCEVNCQGIDYHIRTDGNRFTIVEGVIAQWISVDPDGNLYFSDQIRESVNKLSVKAIHKIVTNQMFHKNLEWTSEPEAEGDEAAREAGEGLLDQIVSTQTVAVTPAPRIMQLYTKGECQHVGSPAGVDNMGDQLFWTNQVGGNEFGSIAEGKVNPRVKQFTEGDTQPTFPSKQLTNATGSAMGIAVTGNKIVYGDTDHCVNARGKGSGLLVRMSCNFIEPRGIAWDGSDTVFVADKDANKVYSMPIGSLKENAPISIVVDIRDPFGVTFVPASDPIWSFDDLEKEEKHKQGWLAAAGTLKSLQWQAQAAVTGATNAMAVGIAGGQGIAKSLSEIPGMIFSLAKTNTWTVQP